MKISLLAFAAVLAVLFALASATIDANPSSLRDLQISHDIEFDYDIKYAVASDSFDICANAGISSAVVSFPKISLFA